MVADRSGVMVGRIAVVACVLAGSVGCSAPAEGGCAKILPGTYKETAEETYGSCGSYEVVTRINPNNPTPFAEPGEGCEILDSTVGQCTIGAAMRCFADGVVTEMTAYLETTATSAVGTGTIEVRDQFGFVCRSTYNMRLERLGD